MTHLLDYCKPGDNLPFEMEEVECDLCGSRRQREVYRRRDRVHAEYAFRLVECCDCGLAFLNPRPTFESLKFFYAQDYYDVMALPSRQKSFENRMNYLGKDPSKTVLDVGCGRGDFPVFLQSRGWKVEGHEVFCSDLIPEVTIHTIPLVDLAQTGKTYDIVCSWAVFEHLTAPSIYFRAIRDLLKPGGTFVFLTHNIDSLAARYFMQDDIPRHLYVFSPKTCKAYLNKYGFELERVYHKDDVFKLYHPHALQWLWSKINGTYYGDYSYTGYPNPAEAKNYLEKIIIWGYNYSNMVLDKSLQIISQIIKKNGTITVVGKKL